jgi:hypothetical protein
MSQRKRWRRRRKAGIPLWVKGVLCIALALAYWAIPPIPLAWRFLAPPEASPSGEPLPVRAAAVARGSGRPVYRHSVIPGGAFSVAELERARRADPVVNAHYAVFDTARLRMTRAAESRSVYVSYRMGRDVYWTRRPIRLTAGEALLTDGEHEARARCGNRVAETRQLPVAAEEPPAADLDAPEWQLAEETDWELPSAIVVDLFPPLPLLPSPAVPDEDFRPTAPGGQAPIPPASKAIPLPDTWSSGTLFPTWLGVTPGGGPRPIPVIPPPGLPADPVPEPDTAILVAAGMALVVIPRIRRRHR